MPVVADTGPLVALADNRDPWHQAVRSAVESLDDLLVIPVTVLPEVDYLLLRGAGPRAAVDFLRSLLFDRIEIAAVTVSDLERAADLMTQYLDNPIGLVDATIVAVAERLGATRLMTLDRRHFSGIRPRHTAAFELLP